MPSRIAYDEAIMLAKATLRVSNPELKEGEVATTSQHTQVGVKPMPWGIEGGFAVVYKFYTKSGNPRALRCFRGAIQPDTQQRYAKLGPYFHTHLADITADFRYYDPGIRVKDPPDPPKLYPIIDMEWVEGMTLLKKVDELCRQRNQAALASLADQWVDLTRKLHQAHVAHGDLAAENVMVRPNGRLVLIDYDGVYIPEFAGMNVLVAGQPDYQHHEQAQRVYNEWLDEFPSLVIYAALRVLQVQPQLWNKYTKRNANGDPIDSNLLFHHSDFVAPDQSDLFRELAQITDPQVKTAVQELKKACLLPIDQVRFPEMDPLRTAYIELEQAVKADDDELIVKLWVPPLSSSPSARSLRPRVEAAQKNVEAIRLLRAALQSGSIQAIATNYTALARSNKNLLDDERKQAEWAQRFLGAYHNDDQLVDVWEEAQKPPLHGKFRFTPAEDQRVTLARNTKQALVDFRQALKNKHLQQIVDTFVPLIQQHKRITPDERARWQLAEDFLSACHSKDEIAILKATAEIENFQHRDSLEFTKEELQRIDLARQRRDALVKLRLAWKERWIAQIAAAYTQVLDGCTSLDKEEREKADLARRFMQACENKETLAIIAIREEIQQSPYETFFRFSPAEDQHIALARQRKTALDEYLKVLQKGAPRPIVALFPPILQGTNSLNQGERKRFQVASNFIQAYDKDDDVALMAAYEAFQVAFQHQRTFFTAEETARVELARRRKEALERFRQVASGQQSLKALDLLAAFPAALLDPCKNVTVNERQLVQRARAFKSMYEAVRLALQQHDDAGIVAQYKDALAKQFEDFTQTERRCIVEAQTRMRLNAAFTQQEYQEVINIAERFQQATGTFLNDVRVKLARQRLLAGLDPKQLEAEIQGNELLVKWKWPAEAVVQHVAVAWSLEHWPQHPDQQARSDHLEIINRAAYDKQGNYKILVGRVARVYVQVYAAFEEHLGGQNSSWFYSEGREPGSKTEARIPCRVFYRLTKRPGLPTNELEIRTDDGAPLPELIIVRKAGGIPSHPKDGEQVAQVGSNGNFLFQTRIPLLVSSWPQKSVVRVFPANTGDTSWLTIEAQPNVRLEVN